MLSEFITENRKEIVKCCRAKVAARSIPTPSEAEINYGVPLFLDQLVDALHSGGTSSLEIDRSAARHGHDLLLKGSPSRRSFTTMVTSVRPLPNWR